MELLQHGQFSPIASEQTPHSPHPYTPYPPIISSQNFLITFIACHLYINFVTVVIEVLINTSMPHTHCDPVTSYSDHSSVDLSSKVFFGILRFIKPDQLDPWIKDQLGTVLPSTILSLQLRNFVSCGRACPSHMTQNLVTVGAKLLTGEWFLFWSLIHGSSWSSLIEVGPGISFTRSAYKLNLSHWWFSARLQCLHC